ncbi:MAG: hypothetical protein N0E45_21760, partial [Candidatus Thiodiazotropha endolucinida]|nr:hypothetical protein [Candidatus Thiodiazotropha taylori]MCW4302260.1 hypothetical protein [Candidatus Thiodiazotropha endolucinida]
MAENLRPLTDDIIVDLVDKCLQQLHFLALHLEILGYIRGLLNGLMYLRRTGDFSGDNLTLGLKRRVLVLVTPCKLTE